MNKIITYAVCIALSLSITSVHACEYDQASLQKIRNACTLLNVSPDDATLSPDSTRMIIQQKYYTLITKYQPDEYDGPEEIRLLSLTAAKDACELLCNNAQAIVYVTTSTKFPENQSRFARQYTFSRQFLHDAVQMVENKHCIWKPTFDHMRCYRWLELMGAIEGLQLDEVRQLLIANPYISRMGSAQAQDTAQVSVCDLVNITDGYTDALSAVLRKIVDQAPTSDMAIRVDRAKAIGALLVSHGAVARFVSEYTKPSRKIQRTR